MQLLQGDCFEVMQGLADNSVDLVLTDPPAGIGFMNCDWDKDKGGRDSWIKWMADIAAECLRVAKPGGHALVWALPRTSHWTATAWENGGWQPRDKIAHVFGTGFPKSHNGPWGGTALKPAMEDWWLLRKPLIGTVAANFAEYGTGGLGIDECRVSTDDSLARPFGSGGISAAQLNAIPRGTITGQDLTGRWPANIVHDGSEEVLALFPMTGKSPAPYIRTTSTRNKIYGTGMGCNEAGTLTTSPADSGSAARFFKECRPESIDLFFCRAKYIMDVLGLTTGIELCQENASFAETNTPQTSHVVASVLSDAVIAASRGETLLSELKELSTVETRNELNLLCESLIVAILISESAQLQDQLLDAHIPNGCHVKFVEMKKQTGTMTITISLPKSGGCVDPVILNITQANMVHGEKVYASRLKYCAKSSKRERGDGNFHPTVKPIALMEYLVQLASRPGAVVLDPFMGSGTTGIACRNLGREFIGIEMNEEYMEIAKRRLGVQLAEDLF